MEESFWKRLLTCRLTVNDDDNFVLALRVYRVLVGKLGRKRSLGRTRRRWEDNIKMDLHKVGCEG